MCLSVKQNKSDQILQLTGSLLTPLSNLYGQFSARYFARLNPTTVNDPDVGYDVEIAQLLFRSIARLMIYVWYRVKQINPTEEQIVGDSNDGIAFNSHQVSYLRFQIFSRIQLPSWSLSSTFVSN